MSIINSLQKFIMLGLLMATTACSYLPFVGDDEEKVELTLREPKQLQDIDSSVEVLKIWDDSSARGSSEKILVRPHADNQNLIVGSESGEIASIGTQDGKPVWKHKIQHQLSGGVGGNREIAVVGTQDGMLKAYNVVDGSERWSVSLGLEVMAIAHTQSDIVVRTNNNQILALYADSGEKRWTVSETTPALTLFGAGVPVVMDGIIYAGMDNGKVVAINLASGNVIWEARVSIPSGRSELDRMVDVDGQIVVAESVVYAASYHGRVMAINRTNGQPMWVRDIASVEGLTSDQALVYVTDKDDFVWALDRATGVTIWKQDQLEYRQLSAPMLLGEHVLVGDFDGYIHVLSKQDGGIVGREEISSERLYAAGTSTPSQVHIIQKSGRLSAISVQ
jgi:outer membrane protein assembly factor BamB